MNTLSGRWCTSCLWKRVWKVHHLSCNNFNIKSHICFVVNTYGLYLSLLHRIGDGVYWLLPYHDGGKCSDHTQSLPQKNKIRLHVNQISNSSRNSYIYVLWSGHTQCILLQDSWPERHKELHIHIWLKFQFASFQFSYDRWIQYTLCTYISVGWVQGWNLSI
jgi:hypothetical protein